MSDAQRNKEVFNALYEQYWHVVKNYLRKKGLTEESAQDVAQDVFHVFWKTYQSNKVTIRDHKSYLFGIADTMLKDFWGQLKAKQQFEQAQQDQIERKKKAGGCADPMCEIDDDLIYAYIEFQELPALRQQCLIYRMQGYPQKEISHLLGVSQSTVSREIRLAESLFK